jgi:hypothetical protein
MTITRREECANVPNRRQTISYKEAINGPSNAFNPCPGMHFRRR